jgi:hypothetical protein
MSVGGSSARYINGLFLKLMLAVGMLSAFTGRSSVASSIDAQRVQKSVIFLYASNGSGEVDKTRPLGTGFIVELPVKNDTGKARRVIVTARHIVDPEWAKCGATNPGEIFARSNKDAAHGGGVDFFSVPLNRTDQSWLHSDNNEVDIAVVPMDHIDISRFDLASIKTFEFPTDEETKMFDIGDQIVSAGLLPDLPGVTRNYPIFKFGRISSIPDEPIETQCNARSPKVFLNLWLVAVTLVSGNSGAPFFFVPNVANPNGPRAVLLGVQSISFFGAGIAGMTPIKYVSEILAKALGETVKKHTDAQVSP